eukprot:9491607-Pyramimonas_sp.AAC.2
MEYISLRLKRSSGKAPARPWSARHCAGDKAAPNAGANNPPHVWDNVGTRPSSRSRCRPADCDVFRITFGFIKLRPSDKTVRRLRLLGDPDTSGHTWTFLEPTRRQ